MSVNVSVNVNVNVKERQKQTDTDKETTTAKQAKDREVLIAVLSRRVCMKKPVFSLHVWRMCTMYLFHFDRVSIIHVFYFSYRFQALQRQ